MLNNLWKIPIGDWSDDGHGKCDWFIIKSNFTVEQAREAYFKSVEESKINISNEIASEYEDTSVSEEVVETFPEFIEKKLIFKDPDYEKYYVEDSFSLAEIVCLFIQRYNIEFEYEILNIPMLPFYGYDKKDRHIGHIGYGLFWC